MKKNKLVLLLAAVLIVFSAGCTSSETSEDEQQVESADIEQIETIDGGAEEAKPSEVADTETTAADDASLEASLNEPAAGESTTTASEDTTTSVAASEPAPAPADLSAPTIDEKSLDASAEAPPPVTDAQLAPDPSLSASTPVDSSPAMDAPTTESTTSFSNIEPTPVAKPASPGSALKKVAETLPYQAKDGGWVNTVYIARPGEKLADISMKIFGADKTKEIKGIAENSFLKYRSVRPGDKIYYVSPNRPDDSTRTILYYEDMGMVPETYVAKKGESLRKIAKELLGYDNAWKEVWTSNGVESKTSLKDGETLRYWKAGAETMVSAPPMPPPTAGADITTQAPPATAMTEPPAMPPADPNAMAGAPPPADPNAGSLPPPPADASASMPPPPTDPNAMASAAPPPPVEDPSVPPPPPPIEEPQPADAGDGATAEAKGQQKLDEEAEAEGEAEGLNSDTLMSMGALGVLLGLLAFVIIRKKKQKSQMNNLEMNA